MKFSDVKIDSLEGSVFELDLSEELTGLDINNATLIDSYSEKNRFVYEILFVDVLNKLHQNLSTFNLADQMLSRYSRFSRDYPIFPIYSSIQEFLSLNCEFELKAVKDNTKYNLPLHIDNSFYLANMFVNLVDNECSTNIHHSKGVYKAPTKKFHGVFFLNNSSTYHSILVDQEYPRWTLRGAIIYNFYQNKRVK